MKKLSTIEKLMQDIKNAGLHFENNYNDFDYLACTTHEAKRYYDKFHKDNGKSYLFGSVPASLENLVCVDYDIIFESLEHIFMEYPEFTNEFQRAAHDFAATWITKGFDCSCFVPALKKSNFYNENKKHIKKRLYIEFLSELKFVINHDWKKNVVEEFKEVLADIEAEKENGQTGEIEKALENDFFCQCDIFGLETCECDDFEDLDDLDDFFEDLESEFEPLEYDENANDILNDEL